MLKKYFYSYFIYMFLGCFAFTSFVFADTNDKVIQLERVNSERVAAKQELLHKKLSSASRRRTFVYSVSALAAAGLCAYWAKNYFWPNTAAVTGAQSNQAAAPGLTQQELNLRLCEQINKERSLWGKVETHLTTGVSIALASVALDLMSRGSNVSWNILQRFLGKTDTTVFLHNCEALGSRIGDLGRALEDFVRTVKIVYAQAQDEGSIAGVSLDQFLGQTDKEFLCADILVSYRAFLDEVEELIALVLESTQDADQQSVLFKESQKNILNLARIVEDCGGYIETLVNNVDALGANKKVTSQAFSFSKKLSMALSPLSGGLGKMLYGVE